FRGATPYALFNSFGAIVDLAAGQVVVRDAELRGGHNLVITKEGVAIANDSLGGTVRVYDLKERKLVRAIDLRAFPWLRGLERQTDEGMIKRAARWLARRPLSSRSIFLRGLAIDGERAFVGMTPAAVVCLDWERGTFIDAFQYSRDVRCCIHGLALAPPASE